MAPKGVTNRSDGVTERGQRFGIPRGLTRNEGVTVFLSQMMGKQGDQREQAKQGWGGARNGLVRPLPLRLDAEMLADFTLSHFNGLITNDKFCITREVHLKLSWWRKPRKERVDIVDAAESCGGKHETRMDEAASADRAYRRPAAVGSGLPDGVDVGNGSSDTPTLSVRSHLPAKP